ncbi:uncharacterized protein LOC142103480 [Mixophyes fleayi]|uniref:uncharacterized protein LOC142103480 n=1 Tax=Mixophyes fleayi TaxID=3061075 RepID=UPI003F4D7753
MNQILFLNQFTVKDCVQSIIDRALEDTNRAQSNYQKLQSAACVTAEALSSIILISTNQTFRKSCYSNLKVCKTRSVISPIQSMYINSVYSQVSITGGACDIEKDVTAVTRVHSHGIMNGMNGSSSQSNDSYEEEEEEGSVLGCSSHCLKKRRCIMETSREDSYQTQQKNTDYLSNNVIQFSYLHGRTCEYDTENLTSIESQASAESTIQEEEDPWLREVCNLAFW